jgi:glutamine synthetase
VPANLALTPFGEIGENPFGPLGDLRLMPDADDQGFRLTGCRDGEPDLRAFLCDIVETDGRPWGGCGRGFLKRALADLRQEAGLTVKAAFEHEFMLQGIPLPANQGFTLIDFRGAQNFIGALQEALEQAGVEPEMLLREYGPNQFEVTVHPAIGLKAADRAVALRDIARDVARQYGGWASFSPILDPTAVGNGVHLHFSLLGADGNAIMHDPARPGGVSQIAAGFVAGILRHMPALCGLTAPSLVSYLRLTPHRWSAGFNCFANRNREAGVRICPVNDSPGMDTASQLHLEFRAGDGTASPYVVLGALVRAGLQGLREQLPAPPLVEGDPADLTAEQLARLNVCRLPASLPEALAALQADSKVMEWLPEPMKLAYFALKRSEIARMKDLDARAQCAAYAKVY